MPMKTDVAIIGAGLAGLALAHSLQQSGHDVQIFEARGRPGGRIAALRTPLGNVDLGPSWFWPGQPRIAQLIAKLGLQAFAQYASGEVSFEHSDGQVQRGVGFASMQGAYRLSGGMVTLVDALVAQLPKARLHLGCPVAGVSENGTVHLKSGTQCLAQHVVIALPPRLAAASLAFHPSLPTSALQALAVIPTWMAGHAKFVAVYEQPFWRQMGLSGDAISRCGPLAEIHDASGPQATPAALFGFLGIAASDRLGHADAIKAASLAQLARIFGAQAAQPTVMALQDWACEDYTAVIADHTPPRGHTAYGHPMALTGLWGGRLHFAATETAEEMGGLMEGALLAADRVAREIADAPWVERQHGLNHF
jgi:monoamine oxidase